MPYPPEFSSDYAYENELNLDNYDVFLEGDGVDPMFLELSGIPKRLSYGKHYLLLTLKDPDVEDMWLKSGSQLLFEAKDQYGTVIWTDFTNIKSIDGALVVSLWIREDPLRYFDDVEDGIGTFSIVGELDGPEVPDEWKGTYNYRCTFPFKIIKNYINADSPKIISPTHKLQTLNGKFSFVMANISIKGGTDMSDDGYITNRYPYDPTT